MFSKPKHGSLAIIFATILQFHATAVSGSFVSGPISAANRVLIASSEASLALSSSPLSMSSHLKESVERIAVTLWGPEELQSVLPVTGTGAVPLSGEATWDHLSSLPQKYAQRRDIFEAQALDGDACAQHSLGLLFWNGFCSDKHSQSSKNKGSNDIQSARWHAAAAVQHHLDALAVLGGCLRTGTGVGQNVKLGLELITFSGTTHQNPTGINKLAALKEASGDHDAAFTLYQSCPKPNALLLMNLGWAYIEGKGTPKDNHQGISFWKEAVSMAPDEGSEEAAWFLYQYYQRDDPTEAQKWLSISASLGFPEALEEDY